MNNASTLSPTPIVGTALTTTTHVDPWSHALAALFAALAGVVRWSNQGSPDRGLLLRDLAEQARLDRLTFVAFPAEAAEEAGPVPFDAVLDREDVAELGPNDVVDAEQYVFDKIPLPGMPQSEGKRRRKWLQAPSG